MKFIVERDALSAAVGGLRAIKSVIPILSSVLVDATAEGKVRLMTHGLDFCCEAKCAAEIESHGRVAIDLAALSGLVNLATAGCQVEISLHDGAATVRMGRSRYRLGVLDPADFPNPIKCESTDRVDLTSEQARRLFDAPSAAMGNEKSAKIYSKGIYLHSTKAGRVGACATTGIYLIRTTVDLEQKIKTPVIVPHDVTHDLVRAAKNGPIRVEWSAESLRMTSGELQVTSKLIDAQFPDYEDAILPEPDPRYIAVERDLLIAAMNRLCLVAPEKGIAKFEWDAGAPSMRISLGGDVASEEVESDGADLDAGGFEVAPKMFLTLLGAVKADVIHIRIEKHHHWRQARITVPEQPTYAALQALIGKD